MKVKHNKKRNTVFLYETLVRELTKAITQKEHTRASVIKNILGEHFRTGGILFSELGCFNALGATSGLDHYTAEKMVFRAKRQYDALDTQEIFKEQSRVIKKINSDLGKQVYNNFVPNYKTYATIAQIFGDKLPLKSRVLMERKIIDTLTAEPDTEASMLPVDSLVVQRFVENFNQEYGDLLPEQRTLLTKYVLAFGDNEVDFRASLGGELKRIYSEVKKSLESEEITNDPEMYKNTETILEQLAEFNVASITDKQLLKVLKLQELVREYQSDAD